MDFALVHQYETTESQNSTIVVEMNNCRDAFLIWPGHVPDAGCRYPALVSLTVHSKHCNYPTEVLHQLSAIGYRVAAMSGRPG